MHHLMKCHALFIGNPPNLVVRFSSLIMMELKSSKLSLSDSNAGTRLTKELNGIGLLLLK